MAKFAINAVAESCIGRNLHSKLKFMLRYSYKMIIMCLNIIYLCVRRHKEENMQTILSAGISGGDIVVIVILALGLLGGLFGGLAKAFSGVFASFTVILVSLLLAGLTVPALSGSALGTALNKPLLNSAKGWGEVFQAEVYIFRDEFNTPVKDEDGNYKYYIQLEDGPVALEDAVGSGLVNKTKGKIAVRLANRFINEETEGQSLAKYAGDALTTLILDIIMFVVFCIVLGLILFLLRRVFKKMHKSDSFGVRTLDRVLGAIIGAALALLFALIVLAIFHSAAGETTKVGSFFMKGNFCKALYTHNPMSGLLSKVFGK